MADQFLQAAPEEKRATGTIVWEAIIDLTNDERSISRQILRDATGLSLTWIDDHVNRLETAGKIIKVGKGLIELVHEFPPARHASITELTNGAVKLELGDAYLELAPKEARTLGRLLAGHARQFEDIEGSNKALIRTAELADRIRDLERQVVALKRVKDDAQLDLLA